MRQSKLHFCPSLCVTHDCNLARVYCYQNHASGESMSFETAKNAIDWIFTHVPDYADGVEVSFIDVDGKRYPCPFITPMTFSRLELDDILKTDFANDENFIDDECFKNCYIYPICPCCSGANYMVNKTFKQRNKSKCRIQKPLALFIADMQAKRIQKNPKRYDDTTLYYTIEAIKKIRELYLDEFKRFLD